MARPALRGPLSAPTIKRQLAAIRQLFDRLSSASQAPPPRRGGGQHLLGPFDRWHRHSGDPEVHRAEEVPVGEIKGLPVRTAEGEVRGLRLAVDNASELLALGVENPDATGAAAIDVPGTVHLHTIRHAGLSPAQVRKYAIGLPRQRAVRRQIERPYVPAPGVVDVEDAFVRRERKAVGNDEIIDEQCQRAEVGGDPVDALIRQVCLVRDNVPPWINEIDRAERR
jgi:hypothetical protein